MFVGYAHRALDVHKCLCCTEGEKEAAWMRGVGLEEVAAAYESELSSVHVVMLINVSKCYLLNSLNSDQFIHTYLKFMQVAKRLMLSFSKR